MAKLTDLRIVEEERPNLSENAEEDEQNRNHKENRNDKENTNAGSLHQDLSVAGTPFTPFLLSTAPIGKFRTRDVCIVGYPASLLTHVLILCDVAQPPNGQSEPILSLLKCFEQFPAKEITERTKETPKRAILHTDGRCHCVVGIGHEHGSSSRRELAGLAESHISHTAGTLYRPRGEQVQPGHMAPRTTPLDRVRRQFLPRLLVKIPAGHSQPPSAGIPPALGGRQHAIPGVPQTNIPVPVGGSLSAGFSVLPGGAAVSPHHTLISPAIPGHDTDRSNEWGGSSLHRVTWRFGR
jgi:hypothetical protein